MMDEKRQEILRHLPKIDEIMHRLETRGECKTVSRVIATEFCRRIVDETRRAVLASTEKDRSVIALPTVEQAAEEVAGRLERLRGHSLKKVVNATGIVLHTNLGRAPLCREAIERVVQVASGYSNLEFDLAEGARGLRDDHVRDVLCALTGAEDALVVNNNAAAVLLVLNTLSQGKEAIVSRGELVEIGGAFRIPEVMEKSGAVLREVGTTNRTHLYDYEQAVSERTGMILKVHTSNFRTVGFTEEVDLSSLASLGNSRGLPVMNDLGSGCFVDLSVFGFEKEPTVQEVIRTGIDVVAFSGDKLLGGPQAGILLGKKRCIMSLRKNPLSRALRIDKMTLAALEATLVHYFDLEEALRKIGILRVLTESRASVMARAENLQGRLSTLVTSGVSLVVRDGLSLAGGGSLPTQEIPTVLLSIRAEAMPAHRIEEQLRLLDVPIIARIAEDELLLDMRTIDEEEFPFIEEGLASILAARRSGTEKNA